MRILHVVNTSDTGGAQTLIESLALGASPDQEVFVVVLSTPGVLHDRLASAAREVIHLGATGKSSEVPSLLLALRGTILRLQPEVVHSHLFQSNLLSAAASPREVRQVWTIHTSGHGIRDRVRTRIVVQMLGLAASRANTLIACSPSAARWLEQRRWAAGRHRTVLNGVALKAGSSGGARSAPTTVPYFLSLARAHEMKDHRNLFAAFAAVRDQRVRLRCAGLDVGIETTTISDALLPLPRSAVDRIDLLGSVEDPSALLQGARALVIASSYGEALPMAALEALAAGVPVITTDVGDCRLTAVSRDLLVPPGDSRALTHALELVLDLGPKQYASLSDAALSASEQFSMEKAVLEYAEIYRGGIGV